MTATSSNLGAFASMAVKEYGLPLLPWASVSLCLSNDLTEEYEEKNLLTYKDEEEQPGPVTENPEAKPEEEKEENKQLLKAEESPIVDVIGAQPETKADLLGFDVINPVAQ